MGHIAHFVMVDAPIARVFAFVSDYRNLPRMQTHFKSVRLLTRQAAGPGARIEARGAFHGLPLHVEMTMVEFLPPHLLVSETVGGVSSRSVWRFSEQPAAAPAAPPRVRASLTMDYEVHLPGIALIGGWVEHDLDALTVDALRRLKLLVEAEPRPA